VKASTLISSTVAAALTIYGPSVDAGDKAPDSEGYVQVGSSNQGALGPARNSSDTKQRIGCVLFGDAASTSVFCFAFDASGHQAGCIGSEASAIAGARALDAASFIAFAGDNGGVCNNIVVTNSSRYSPKGP
jgi:hypothetical protein